MVVPVLYVAYTAVMSAAGVCPALSVHRCPPSFSPIEQSGGYSAGVPPLPIPNREVKPVRADGTAMQCGRVGSRLFSVYVLPENVLWKDIFCFTSLYVFYRISFDSCIEEHFFVKK